MKRTLAVLLASAMLLGITSCSQPSDGGQAESQPPASDVKPSAEPGGDGADRLVCLISEAPAGEPFTELTWDGFEKLQQTYGVQIKLVEALEPAEYEEQIRAMADMGADPIYTMYDAVSLVALELADEYPDTRFIPIDCNEQTTQENVSCIVVDSYEPSFVAGVVAALTTETGKLGWVGCLDIPVINRFYDGYAAGVAYANETYGLNVTVEKAYIGDSSDTVKGAETANMIMDKGVDIVYHAANQAGLGVIQACVDKGVKCIGVDEWQGYIDPLVYWSALIAINDAVYSSYTSFTAGELPAGETVYGISTGAPIYADSDYDNLPDDVKTAVDTLLAGVRDSSIDMFSYLQQ